VQVVVLLATQPEPRLMGQRQSPTTRKATAHAPKQSAQQSLANLDPLLQDFGGHPLKPEPDGLGSISIEISAAGVAALARSKLVKAVMEDQTLYPVV
jgi:hypothetical protein